MTTRYCTQAEIREQLQQLAACETEAEANARYMNPLQCSVGAYRLLTETRLAGEDIRDAAKRAMEGM